MSRLCVAWNWTLRTWYYLHDKLPNESKCLNNNDYSKKNNNFLPFFPRWKRFLCGPQLFVKLRSQQSKQSCDSFFLVCSTNKSLGFSMKGKSVCTRMLLVYLLVNNIKSYKNKEIFGKLFIAEGRENAKDASERSACSFSIKRRTKSYFPSNLLILAY